MHSAQYTFYTHTCSQTALVEGLAARVTAGDVPEPLQGVQVMALDMGLLMAGVCVGGHSWIKGNKLHMNMSHCGMDFCMCGLRVLCTDI